MRVRIARHLFASAALLYAGCAVPGPVIVVTEPGFATPDAMRSAPRPERQVAVAAVDREAVYEPPSAVDALEAQHTTVERRVAALERGVTRVRGRQMVTKAIGRAVENRVGSLESRIAALEVEFDRRAKRVDSILSDLREQLPDIPDAPTADPSL
jgi:uncharacterized protein YceH (UPF0502 family)